MPRTGPWTETYVVSDVTVLRWGTLLWAPSSLGVHQVSTCSAPKPAINLPDVGASGEPVDLTPPSISANPGPGIKDAVRGLQHRLSCCGPRGLTAGSILDPRLQSLQDSGGQGALSPGGLGAGQVEHPHSQWTLPKARRSCWPSGRCMWNLGLWFWHFCQAPASCRPRRCPDSVG